MRRQTNSETTKVESTPFFFYSPNRRGSPSADSALVPFLSPQAGFHPKRNQARQKLATLPSSRFQDLTSDVRHELGRRYPACKEEVMPFSFPLVQVTFLIGFAAL